MKGTDGAFKCINIIGSAESNGILKNLFIHSIKTPGTGLDLRAYSYLKDKGFPEDFIDFLGGVSID